jgi:hypothetical protein
MAETVTIISRWKSGTRRSMIRLNPGDCEQSEWLTRCAAVVGLAPEALRERFAR